jgi:nucleoside-diphosphate-sugar epimerase
LIVTSGTALVTPGRLATEEDAPDSDAFPRVASEEAATSLAARGVRVSLVRLSPSVHGEGDHGFVPTLISIAREKSVSAYVGDGLNRWTAVHRLDAAHLFRLALEKATAGTRFHGVAEEAPGHFGWFAAFAGLDCPASSKRTQELLGWRPKQPRLIADLDRPSYFET